MASAISWLVFLIFLADVAWTLVLGSCRWLLVLYLSHVIYVWLLHFMDSDGKNSLSWKFYPIKPDDISISAESKVISPQFYDYRRIVVYSLHPFILLSITVASIYFC